MKIILCLLLLSMLTASVYTEACQGGQWSQWISRDLPLGNGDFEDLKNILSENPNLNCANPTELQARTVLTKTPASQTGQIFAQNQLPQGFVCVNAQQTNGQCLNYEVRFCCPVCQDNAWTAWVNRDLPSGYGDSENIQNLLQENYITCGYPTIVEARVASTKVTAYATGQKFQNYRANYGFNCLNSDQPNNQCLDYEVRFCCPDCNTATHQWSQWFDRDNPSGFGDSESYALHVSENPSWYCPDPLYIQARTVSTHINALATGQKLQNYQLPYGFNCYNPNQPNYDCQDYEVRFCCPKKPLVCQYEYWEFLAIGYPYYHRSQLDLWCGPYPPQFSNCYDWNLNIAPTCTETFPNFSTILAGDSSVDFNKRCFLHCT